MGNKDDLEVIGKQRSIACFITPVQAPTFVFWTIVVEDNKIKCKRVEDSSGHANH